MNPTPSDIAAAKEIFDLWIPAPIEDYSEIISRHMQPERELLLELADMSCFKPWDCLCRDTTGGEPDCISCRARQWKQENGL